MVDVFPFLEERAEGESVASCARFLKITMLRWRKIRVAQHLPSCEWRNGKSLKGKEDLVYGIAGFEFG
jgi:hypothetical protein